ncbi:hypothetical protein J2T20_003133 [Paenibacillus wynnii]|nr:hypothetical protein [Paenibacillus wynnii]
MDDEGEGHDSWTNKGQFAAIATSIFIELTGSIPIMKKYWV